MASPRSFLVAAAAAAILSLTAGIARAQASMTPTAPVAVPSTPPAEPPHHLGGKPIFGALLGYGDRHDVRNYGAYLLDAWAGIGVSDRLAVLGFAEACIDARSQGFAALGAGVRGWPFAAAPSISIEGRAGVAERDGLEHRNGDLGDPLGGWIAGGSVILDVARQPVLGLELRGTIEVLHATPRTDLIAFIGVGGSLY
jgi:hypothetical protein